MGRPRKNAAPRDTSSKEAKPSNVVQAPDAVMEQLEKSLMSDYKDFLNDSIPDRREDLFKLHIPSLNHALAGGLPRGQMVHLYGPEGCGKSTLALHIAADIQKQGGRVLYADVENSLDRNYALHIGVDPTRLRYQRRMSSGEAMLDFVEKGVRGGIYSLIVIDSVASLLPAAIGEANNEQMFIGAQARMMAQALMKLNNACINSNSIILWVNQQRANIQTGYGVRPFTTPGGKALPFYTNVALYMQRIGQVKEGETIIGQQVRIKVEKNKIGPPMRQAECYLIYGEGIRKDWDLIVTAREKGIITQKGAGWMEYNGTKVGQGLKAVVEYGHEHPEFLTELEQKLYNIQPAEAPEVAELPAAETPGE
jgi:recombination protein RecA